jgi:mono/diheme cytochrome c family protein
MRSGEKYDAARVRTLGVLIATASAALLLGACGSESVSVPQTDAAAYEGAQIFASHCAGCHTISAAGTQGSGNRALRVQGPNFDQRKESYDDVLFAIHNGGFSGAIMPQDIVVGKEAEQVADFLAKYAGHGKSKNARN